MGNDMTGRRLFLTGGSRGIGKCIGSLFADRGAEVIAPGRDELDLSSRDSIQGYLRKHGDMSVDMFIHCAGINELAGVEEIDDGLVDRVFQINYHAPLALLKAFVPAMRANQYGKIVFISSLYAIVSRERRIAYSSSKNALTGLMKTLALELAPDQIMVNAIAPGYVMTEMTKKNLTGPELERIQSSIPTGRFQSERDIASLAAFLCSAENQSITGQLIAVDGGFTCR